MKNSLKTKNIAVSDYFDCFSQLQKEFGDRICLLMQIGSFYEIQQIETIGNADIISKLLNIQLTKKNKKIAQVSKTNPMMCGFPMPALMKYLNILLNNNFTVIIVDQLTNGPKTDRKIAKIYSPGIPPLMESVDSSNSTNQFLACLYIEDNSAGLCFVDMTTGQIDIHEVHAAGDDDFLLDKVYSILQKYEIVEYIVSMKSTQSTTSSTTAILKQLDLYHKDNVHVTNCDPNYQELQYQEAFFQKIFKNEMGLLSCIEYLDLEHKAFARIALMIVLEFIFQHNESYLEKLSKPNIIEEFDYLVLASNTIQQLNLFPNEKSINSRFDSLFSVFNNVTTTLGKRRLRQLLSRPFIRKESMELSYDLTESLATLDGRGRGLKKLEAILSEICDITRLHRKMSLGIIQPYEFARLYHSYKKIQELHTLISQVPFFDKWSRDTCEFNVAAFAEYTQNLEETFDFDILEKTNFNSSAADVDVESMNFYKQTEPHLQKLLGELELKFKLLNDQCTYLNQMLGEQQDNFVKIAYLDSEGYYLTTTNIRGDILKKKLAANVADVAAFNDFQFKSNKSGMKITSSNIEKWSATIVLLKSQIKEQLKVSFENNIAEYTRQYECLFNVLTTFVETIDVIKSNYITANKYNYTRPKVLGSGQGPSQVTMTKMRHPLLERILQDTKYIPNDISLGNASGSGGNGIVLYGLNACGKSSLLRAIGLNIILAQCGFFVPCEFMEFVPFRHLISQVDLHDNMWKGQSSFITEMVSLRNIFKQVDTSTLVLADELCKGSEMISATAIFASTVDRLIEKGTKFVFTTHLHKVAELEQIKKNKQVQIKHLAVTIEKDSIIFDRTLKDGPCESLYGLEVAKALNMDPYFIKNAFRIRNVLTDKKSTLLVAKKSKYNSQKLTDECEICKWAPKKECDQPLHTHHIEFQCTANEKGFIDHFHKNAKFNLVTLCSSCHQQVHENKIEIKGYSQTTKGVQLLWNKMALCSSSDNLASVPL